MDSHASQPPSGLFDTLAVPEEARMQLAELAKWAKFLAIVHFVFIGLMILIGGFTAVAVSSLAGEQLGAFAGIGGIGIFAIYLLVAALIIYPFYAMLRYANGMRAALRTNNEGQFANALRDLKRVFKYWGILTLIGLGLYALIFLLAGIGSAFR